MNTNGRAQQKVNLANRRRQVAEMYNEGRFQSDIAADLGVNQSTVSRDIAWNLKQWALLTVRDIDLAKGEELAKINKLEREWWGLYTYSKEFQEREFTTADGKTTIIHVPQAGRDFGNPKYLRGVRDCIKDRIELLGLAAPIRIQGEIIDWRTKAIEGIQLGKVKYPFLVKEVGQSLAEELFKSAGIPSSPE